MRTKKEFLEDQYPQVWLAEEYVKREHQKNAQA